MLYHEPSGFEPSFGDLDIRILNIDSEFFFFFHNFFFFFYLKYVFCLYIKTQYNRNEHTGTHMPNLIVSVLAPYTHSNPSVIVAVQCPHVEWWHRRGVISGNESIMAASTSARKSPVWKHFKITEDKKKAVCQICAKSLAYDDARDAPSDEDDDTDSSSDDDD